MVRFDQVDDWESQLSAALAPWVPLSVQNEVREAAPQFVEDALDIVLAGSRRRAVVEAAVKWSVGSSIGGYHGSRLTSEEIDDVARHGLVPLSAEGRRRRLVRALRTHPDWLRQSDQLSATLESFGGAGAAGERQGQVHLTLSLAGLTESFSHYLQYGSEFDQCVARELFGDDGPRLLSSDGHAVVVEVSVPGEMALNAANPYFSVEDRMRRDEVPNLVESFLQAWSYRLANPRFQPSRLKLDCGMIFYSTIPPAWIEKVSKTSIPGDQAARLD